MHIYHNRVAVFENGVIVQVVSMCFAALETEFEHFTYKASTSLPSFVPIPILTL